MRCFLRQIQGLLLSLAFAGTAEAATVKSIKTPKRIVIVNEGTKTGFLKKKKVCFYDPAGKIIACGRVRAAKDKISSVLIKKEADLAKISVGMEARIAVDTSKDVKISIDDSAPAPVEEAYSAPYYLGLFGAFSVKDEASYKNLVYETPLGQDVESMWSQESDVKSVGLGAEIGIGIKGFTLALGGRSRTFSPKRIASDYDDKDQNDIFEDYVETTGKGQSTGFWLDFYYLRWDWGVASLNIGNGIDMDTSVVKFTVDQLSDESDDKRELYKGKSTLKALSLRTDLLLDFNFGPVGFKMGTNIFVPLSQSQKIKVVHSDQFAVDKLKGKTVEEDVKESLAHKASLGVDMIIMGYFSF